MSLDTLEAVYIGQARIIAQHDVRLDARLLASPQNNGKNTNPLLRFQARSTWKGVPLGLLAELRACCLTFWLSSRKGVLKLGKLLGNGFGSDFGPWSSSLARGHREYFWHKMDAAMCLQHKQLQDPGSQGINLLSPLVYPCCTLPFLGANQHVGQFAGKSALDWQMYATLQLSWHSDGSRAADVLGA